jgi:hypothetical protein
MVSPARVHRGSDSVLTRPPSRHQDAASTHGPHVAQAPYIIFHPSLLVRFSSGVAPALILLRPSSEALLRARATGAGD